VDTIKSVFKFIDEVLVEPILFGAALVLVLSHIQYVFNNSELSFRKFWSGLMTDVTGFWWVYVPFVVLFVWWLISKALHRRREKSIAQDTVRVLERALSVLERIEKRLDDYDKRNPPV
jgi:hypothetical protein